MRNIIQIDHLCKSFGEVQAVRDLSFCVREGQLFAFLGANGAGKSTTINIMCGELLKDSGRIEIDSMELERNSERIKSSIGVVFQGSVLDAPLSVYDNLQTRAALYSVTGDAFRARLEDLSRLLELDEFMKRPVGKLSGGQRRRADIACALINRPKILILDEPTTGLDPQTRKLLWNVISERRKNENMTVFLTTHYMEEAAGADYVVIIDGGKTSAEGTPLALRNAYSHDFIMLYGVSEAVVQELGVHYETLRDGYRIAVENTAKATEIIVKHPEIFLDYEIIKGNMDDVFLNVTGKRLEGGATK